MSFRFFIIGVAVLMTACTPNMIREKAQDQIRSGEYEQALNTLRKGLDRFPLDPVLTVGERTARETVAARLFDAATAQRTAGDLDSAEKSYREAIRLDVGRDRASVLLAEIERDRRAETAAAETRKFIEEGKQEKALRRVREGLRDQPRNIELQKLERQIESENYRREELRLSSLADSRPVSLSMRDANLKMIFDALSRETKINFVLDKDIRADARATLFLRETRLDEAVDLLLGANGLNKKIIDPHTVQVYPNTPEKNKEYQDLVVRSFFLSGADAKKAAALLKTLIKIREPFIDENLDLLVLRDTVDNIRLAEKILDVYDQNEPEVMMEVEVLEVNATRASDIGLSVPDSVTLNVVAPTNGLTLEGLKHVGSSQIGVSALSATLNLKNQSGDFTILANPRIRAKNREKAKILVGDRLPVITTTTSSTGFVSESVQYVDVGIRVEFEPVVTLDNEVSIKVNLEVSSLSQQVKTTGGSLAYQISTRTATTTLKLHDGETQVLGGLINNQDRNAANRIPIIGELPIVGRLFSSKTTDNSRTEIVLSITPRVLRNIQRPHPGAAEFFSGTEGLARLRPVRSGQGVEAAEGIKEKASLPKVATDGGIHVANSTPVSVGNDATPTLDKDVVRNLSVDLRLPGEVKIHSGDIFKVPLTVLTTARLRGLPLQLEYDPKQLELIDVEEGGFFKQGNARTSFVRAGNGRDGRIAITVLRDAPEGATGEGQVVQVSFKARATGETVVKLGQATALPSDAATSVIAAIPSAVRVYVK